MSIRQSDVRENGLKTNSCQKKYHNGEFSKRFLANTTEMVVHDLMNERDDCHVDEIIDKGVAKLFDYHWQAQSTGFINCSKCIGKASKQL